MNDEIPIRSATPIYGVVLQSLQGASQPLTAREVMEIPEVREAARKHLHKGPAVAILRLSDKLGLMWKRGMLDRHPVSHRVFQRGVRFSYALKGKFSEYGDTFRPPELSRYRSTFSPASSAHTRVNSGGTAIEILESNGSLNIAYKGLNIVFHLPEN